MRTNLRRTTFWTVALGWLALAGAARGADQQPLPPVSERFASGDTEEVPNFQKHVVPLMGRLGCNGRACHGSFQGQGDFRLSLFGYDFGFDHEQLTQSDSPRVVAGKPAESLILIKPTDEFEHGGGLRYEKDSWHYHVFRRWVESGAPYDAKKIELLKRLEVTPSEIIFDGKDQSVQLKAVAVWENGEREDVTDLCRFQTNNEQVARIDEWGKVQPAEAGDTHVVVFYDNAVVPVPVIRPVTPLAGAKYPSVPTPTKIDELVVEKLRKLGVVPSETAEDAEFLRRVSLDLTGTLPAPEDVEEFLADKSPLKRAEKIDELLETPAYAAWWTTRLCDYTGNNEDQLVNTTPVRGRASQDWYDWIYKRVQENVPYDELVSGIVLSQSREPGESYREYCERMSEVYREDGKSFAECSSMPYYWARREFRQPDERAISFAYAFMGIRIQCAQCHKHPFDQWSKQDFEDFTGFFRYVTAAKTVRNTDRDEYNQLVESLGLKGKKGNDLRRALPDLISKGEVVPFSEIYPQPPRANNGNSRRGRGQANQKSAVLAKLLGSEAIDLTQYEDAREPLMEWLRAKDNPYLARAFVNRVWANYFNVGIVNPPDDLSLANPPSNQPLLDYLSQGFIDNGFDMKWLHREIANSRTYQLSWRPNETNAADERNFSRAIPRRLPAEVAYDAVQLATASSKKLREMATDLDGRAIAIAAAGRRYNNGRNNAAYALTVFGRSTRESSCDCDRSAEASLLQTVFLQNDRDMLGLLDRRDGWIQEVSKQFGGDKKADKEKVAAAVDPKQQANVQKQLVQARKQMARARKTGNRQQMLKLQRRLLTLQEQSRTFVSLTKRAENERKSAESNADVHGAIRQAYLRTLSRYPQDWELERSAAFIAESEDPVSGLRGLMWALLNTKEFIVNH